MDITDKPVELLTTDKPGWLSRTEAAKRVGRSPRTINRWREEGRLTWAYTVRGGQVVPVYDPESLPSPPTAQQDAA